MDELAVRQAGAVSVEQLAAAELGRGAIDLRVRNRRLHRVHRGVYAVGRRDLTFRGRLWAAVLAAGGPDVATVTHHAAAADWELVASVRSYVDVSTARGGRSTKTLHVHKAPTLDPARDVVLRDDGLPVTTVARTIFDLAPGSSQHRIERLCHRGEVLRIFDARALESLIAAHPRRPGNRALRAALETLILAEPQMTRSELEERFLELVAEAGVPRPLVNTIVAGFEVDFYWPELRLVVEIDGRGAHLRPTAFEADRRRDVALKLAAIDVVRFTWRWVVDEPQDVIATLRRLALPS